MRNIITSTIFAGVLAAMATPASALPVSGDTALAKVQPAAESVRYGGGFRGGGFRGGYGGRGFGGGGRGYYGGGRGYYGRGYGRGYGGLGYGLAAGALLGGALAYPYYSGGYYNGVYDEGTVVEQTDGATESPEYCARRYKSYDPRSGTYFGYDGLRHPCG